MNPALKSTALIYMLGCSAFFFSGCLYSTHHFNTGRILEPGKTAVGLTYGSSYAYEVKCPQGQGYWGYEVLEDGSPVCLQWSSSQIDTVPANILTRFYPKIGFDYRLGVRGKWGPFSGVEIGYHHEVPLHYPPLVAFDIKLGLTPFPGWASAHSVSAGWIIGMWADNSWFMEYGASRFWGSFGLYGNLKATWLATQPFDIMRINEDLRFIHKRRWINQGSLGVMWDLPNIPVIPDYFSPQVTFTWPGVPATEEKLKVSESGILEWNVNWTFGWKFN